MSRSTIAPRVVLVAAFGLVRLASAAHAGGAADADLLRQVRSTVLNSDRAMALTGVELELGIGRFAIERGVLFPASTPEGRTVELVFIGQARFRLEPPDPIEAAQLELFTGERGLDAPVEEAVLVLTDGQEIERLLAAPRSPSLAAELVGRAQELHRLWLDSTERRNGGPEAALFKYLAGDEAYRDWFALWCRSRELGRFVYQLDPESAEAVTLAHYIPANLSGWQALQIRRHLKLEQRKGRWLGVRAEDLGMWDVWLSTPWTPPSGQRLPGSASFDAEHYALDVTISQEKLRLSGVARLELISQGSGRRVVTLELFRDLQVERVLDGRGRPLSFARSDADLLVRLPEPSRAGEKLTLEVHYGGRALAWIQGKFFDLRHTSAWYPSRGTQDRATYDVTLHWPAKYEIVASGHRVDQGREGKQRWERRRLELPAIAFSFVLGDFSTETKRVGSVDVTVAFNRNAAVRLTPELRAEVLDTVARSLEFFERTFGPYPLADLTVVTVPRGYSQSFLGFMTLADSILWNEDPSGRRDPWTRNTTIAHELAHQWWGNLVGWASYRDQWLSEGMANYAALLFDAASEGDRSDLLATMSSGWRESLSSTLLGGRTVESLGPVVLGPRLNSSLARNAYRWIVYRKGAVVLSMLARAVGEERFNEMLRSLVDAKSHGVLTTEGFLEAVERVSGLELEGFARQFIYGTGIPQVYYDYDLAREGDGDWILSGEANLVSVPSYRHRVVRTDGGGWDLLRTARPAADNGPTSLIVPFRLMLDQDVESTGAGMGQLRTPRGYREGKLFLDGNTDRFEIQSERKPIDLRLDPQGEVLARFYPAASHGKQVWRHRADDLAARGRHVEAEAGYLEALQVPAPRPVVVDPLVPRAAGAAEPGGNPDVENARIRLDLARLYLDQHRDPDAESTLAALDRQLEGSDRDLFRMERDALMGLIEIRRGQYAAAHERLHKTLRLAFPRSGRSSWRILRWQLQLGSEREAVSEACALLAITAYATADTDDLLWAVEQAKARGADVSLIESLSAGGAASMPARRTRER